MGLYAPWSILQIFQDTRKHRLRGWLENRSFLFSFYFTSSYHNQGALSLILSHGDLCAFRDPDFTLYDFVPFEGNRTVRVQADFDELTYTRRATRCAQCAVHARSTLTHTHDSYARLPCAPSHEGTTYTARATRPRTSILCPQPTPAVGAHRTCHRTALSSWCTRAAHVLHGDLAQPTQSFKRLAVYTLRARRRCSASSPVRQQVRCVRTRPVCVQQAAVALTSRQQRRCTLRRTLLVRLSDEGYHRWKAQAACTAWHGVAGRPRSPCRRRRVLGRAGRVPTVPCVRILSDYCDHHAV